MMGVDQHVTQSALVDGDGDVFAGPRHDLDQEAQMGCDATVFALLFDQVLRQAAALGGGGHRVYGCSSARVTTSRTSLLRSGLAATR